MKFPSKELESTAGRHNSVRSFQSKVLFVKYTVIVLVAFCCPIMEKYEKNCNGCRVQIANLIFKQVYRPHCTVTVQREGKNNG